MFPRDGWGERVAGAVIHPRGGYPDGATASRCPDRRFPYDTPDMAGKIREIKARQKAVGNIQRITKTMQMIATARFQAMQRRATEAQAYARKIREVVGELASAVAGEVSHPLLAAPEPAAGRRLMLVISSNRGLCGGYNANILRESLREYRRLQADGQVDLEIVGKKAQSFFKFNQVPVSAYHSHFGDTADFADVDALAQRYIDAFTEGRYDAVQVVSMRFHTMSRQTAETTPLLPLEPPAADAGSAGGGTTLYEFSPEPEELLNELLPVTVKTALFQAFNEALVSEQLARMVAMKAATDAAGKLKKDLSRQFNRARQTAITTELSEIIGGAAAIA